MLNNIAHAIIRGVYHVSGVIGLGCFYIAIVIFIVLLGINIFVIIDEKRDSHKDNKNQGE